ncbi:hypothetical protein M0812_18698 [Anaeramoeba flamelloides]|uniref:Transmembrane protein n=1 Tax=Anaeramoeba flamelloides TaxID=1746091 RepID=A0AAV7Z8H0_9EUKA|nr:hypothetical protein M0812_18698 [Anaeramoeba flamelloides]
MSYQPLNQDSNEEKIGSEDNEIYNSNDLFATLRSQQNDTNENLLQNPLNNDPLLTSTFLPNNNNNTHLNQNDVLANENQERYQVYHNSNGEEFSSNPNEYVQWIKDRNYHLNSNQFIVDSWSIFKQHYKVLFAIIATVFLIAIVLYSFLGVLLKIPNNSNDTLQEQNEENLNNNINGKLNGNVNGMGSDNLMRFGNYNQKSKTIPQTNEQNQDKKILSANLWHIFLQGSKSERENQLERIESVQLFIQSHLTNQDVLEIKNLFYEWLKFEKNEKQILLTFKRSLENLKSQNHNDHQNQNQNINQNINQNKNQKQIKTLKKNKIVLNEEEISLFYEYFQEFLKSNTMEVQSKFEKVKINYLKWDQITTEKDQNQKGFFFQILRKKINHDIIWKNFLNKWFEFKKENENNLNQKELINNFVKNYREKSLFRSWIQSIVINIKYLKNENENERENELITNFKSHFFDNFVLTLKFGGDGKGKDNDNTEGNVNADTDDNANEDDSNNKLKSKTIKAIYQQMKNEIGSIIKSFKSFGNVFLNVSKEKPKVNDYDENEIHKIIYGSGDSANENDSVSNSFLSKKLPIYQRIIIKICTIIFTSFFYVSGYKIAFVAVENYYNSEDQNLKKIAYFDIFKTFNTGKNPFVGVLLIKILQDAITFIPFISPLILTFSQYYLNVVLIWSIPFWVNNHSRFKFFYSLSLSFKIVNKNFFETMFFCLLILGLNVIGGLFFGIGILFSIPFGLIILTIAYEKLFGIFPSNENSNNQQNELQI